MNIFVIALISIAVFSFGIFGYFMTGDEPTIQFPSSEHYDNNITELNDKDGLAVSQKSFLVVENNTEIKAYDPELENSKDKLESSVSFQDSNSYPAASPMQIKILAENQVRRGTTHSIDIQVVRGSSPVEGARVFLDIEDYGENIIKESKGYTDSQGFFRFSWEIPQSFDDLKTLMAIIDVTDGISSKTELFKFQVYCLPGEQNCKVKGN